MRADDGNTVLHQWHNNSLFYQETDLSEEQERVAGSRVEDAGRCGVQGRREACLFVNLASRTTRRNAIIKAGVAAAVDQLR